MYTPEQRSRLRSDLLKYAANDRRISGAAITGSAAADREDGWSDIDLAFGVADIAQLQPVLADWTTLMYDQHGALDHLDVTAGVWIYRVFLLPTTLQVDLAFVPADQFRALGPTFRLVFGKENEPRHASPQAPAEIIGLGWLYALHARSCIARRQLWQAEYMISSLRDQALALACIRHGLPSTHGRGIDQLPGGVATRFEGSLVGQLDGDELSRAFQVATLGLLSEIRSVDEALALRLHETLVLLSEPPL